MINYITYKEEKYPLRVSYYAVKQYELETGKKISSLDESTSNLEILLWYALIAGSKAENKVLHLTREDCEFILDESMTEFADAISHSFGDDKSDLKVSKKK